MDIIMDDNIIKNILPINISLKWLLLHLIADITGSLSMLYTAIVNKNINEIIRYTLYLNNKYFIYVIIFLIANDKYNM